MKNHLLVASFFVAAAIGAALGSCNNEPGKTPGGEKIKKLEVTPPSIQFAAEDPEVQYIAVTAENVEWDASVNTEAAGWLTVYKLADKIRVSADPNTTADERPATITVFTENDALEPKIVSVTQQAGNGGGTPVVELPSEVELGVVYSAEYNGDSRFGKGSGHFAVTFMNIENISNAAFESFTVEGFMPLIDDPTQDAVKLATGTYTYEPAETFTGTPMTFMSYYGEVENFGTYYMSTLFGADKQQFYPVYGGTIVVEDAGFGNVSVVADVVNDKGVAMKATYVGPLTLDNTEVDTPAAYNVTFTAADLKSAVNVGQYFEQPIREYELAFSKTGAEGEDYITHELVMRFNVDLEYDDGLPTGRYFPFTTEKYAPRAPFTYMRGGTSGTDIMVGSRYISTSSLYGRNIVLLDEDGGYIDMENHGDGTYTIKVRVFGTKYDMTEMTKTPATRVDADYTGPISY